MPLTTAGIYYADTSTNMSIADITAAMATSMGNSIKVLQTIQVVKTDSYTTTSNTFVDVTGLTATITPKFATSKILVSVTGVAGNGSAAEIVKLNLVRNGTNIAQSTGSGVANQTMAIWTNNTSANDGFNIEFLDSPATTAATTYKLQIASTASAGAVIGRFAANDNFRSISTITLTEITA